METNEFIKKSEKLGKEIKGLSDVIDHLDYEAEKKESLRWYSIFFKEKVKRTFSIIGFKYDVNKEIECKLPDIACERLREALKLTLDLKTEELNKLTTEYSIKETMSKYE